MERLNEEVYKHEHLYDSSSRVHGVCYMGKLWSRGRTWCMRRQNEAVLRVIKGILQRVLPLKRKMAHESTLCVGIDKVWRE